MGSSARNSPVVNETAHKLSSGVKGPALEPWASLGPIQKSETHARASTHTQTHKHGKVIDHHEGQFANVRQRRKAETPA